MLAYTRQMLHGSRQDPEDAVQEIFVRAYGGLRASSRDLALRAWLYRIAHNRCIDELRRPRPTLCEEVETTTPSAHDPFVKVEQRDALRRLIADVQRLPEQQRSALLMRELAGMAYSDMSGALGVSVPAVKSLLVRARVGLAQASEARDTACSEIRDDVIQAHDRGVRTSGLARRHMRDCPNCREFRTEVRGMSRQFAALAPTLGPLGVIAHLLGWGGGGAVAGGGAAGAAGGGGAVAGGGAAGAAGGGAAASAGLLAGGAGHVVTLLAAAVVTAGGAVELQRTLAPAAPHRTPHHVVGARPDTDASASIAFAAATVPAPPSGAQAPAASPAPTAGATGQRPSKAPSSASVSVPGNSAVPGSGSTTSLPISETLDPDKMMYTPNNPAPGSATGPGTGTPPGGAGATGTGSAGGTTGTTPPGPGATGSGSPGTGTTGTGTPGSGTPGTGNTGTGSPGGGSPGTGSTGTGSTGSRDTGSTGTASPGGGTSGSPTRGGGGTAGRSGTGGASTSAGAGHAGRSGAGSSTGSSATRGSAVIGVLGAGTVVAAAPTKAHRVSIVVLHK